MPVVNTTWRYRGKSTNWKKPTLLCWSSWPGYKFFYLMAPVRLPRKRPASCCCSSLSLSSSLPVCSLTHTAMSARRETSARIGRDLVPCWRWWTQRYHPHLSSQWLGGWRPCQPWWVSSDSGQSTPTQTLKPTTTMTTTMTTTTASDHTIANAISTTQIRSSFLTNTTDFLLNH